MLPQIIVELAHATDAKGGRLYAVGGWVRDQLLGLSSKDVDCEVHGLELEQVEALLQERGSVNFVGRSFGVFKLSTSQGIFDIALPRVDLSAKSARPEPHLGLLRACERRDFRCNALLYDPLTEEIIDLVGGRKDLQQKILRAVDPTRFGEDPLRALRAVRFSASLNFSPDAELIALCQSMPLGAEPVERIWGELSRTLLSPHPGRGLKALLEFRQLDVVLPELSPDQVSVAAKALERAVPLRDRLAKKEGALSVMLGVLLHFVEEPQRSGLLARFKIKRPGGVPVRQFLLDLGPRLPLQVPPPDSALRGLSEIGPMAWVIAVAAAIDPALDFQSLSGRYRELGVAEGPLPVLLCGEDLKKAGIFPGPEMGRVLKALRKVQLNGGLSTRTEALDWLLRHLASCVKSG